MDWMSPVGRRTGVIGLLLLLVSLGLPCVAPAQPIDWPLNPGAEADSALARLFFFDAENGWAIGQRGIVLRTQNGGMEWTRVVVPVACDLTDITFVSPARGWISGGYRLPGSSNSRGVLLETRDGGVTWELVAGLDLPRIERLFLSNSGEGLAIGDQGFGRPTGIFRTSDGGRSWSSSPRGRAESWDFGIQRPDGRLVMGSADGDLAIASDSGWDTATLNARSSASLNDVCLVTDQTGIAVGDGGLVWQTNDGGVSWTEADFAGCWTPGSVDFDTVCFCQDRIWAAGNPGGSLFRIERSADGWTRLPLPVTSGVTALQFLDRDLGWLATQGGDILVTRDGGDSWSIQRRGARGVAILQVATEPRGFEPDLFAKYCTELGYVGGGLLVPRDVDETALVETCALDDCRQALGRVGASFVMQCPAHVRATSANATPTNLLREYLVRQIRALQPRVITLSRSDVGGEDSNLRNAVLAAVEDAADPVEFPHHMRELGLEPWQAGLVLLVDPEGIGDSFISQQEFLPGASCLVGDLALPSRALLGRQASEGRGIAFTSIYAGPVVAGRTGDFMLAIERVDGKVPRRRSRRHPAGNLFLMKYLANKQKTLEALLAYEEVIGKAPPEFARDVAALCNSVDDATAGVWLYELGELAAGEGKTGLARYAFGYVLDKYRRHLMALPSCLKLYDDLSSAEATHVLLRRSRAQAQSMAAIPASDFELPVLENQPKTRTVTRNENGVAVTVWEAVQEESDAIAAPQIQQVSFTEQDQDQLVSLRREQAWSLAQTLRTFDRGALDTNRRALSRVRLHETSGPEMTPESQLRELAEIAPETLPVSSLALRELSVVRQDELEAANRFGVVLHPASDRPWLDGKLGDSLWQDIRAAGGSLPLLNSQQQVVGHVLVACDDAFLYLAGYNTHLPGRIPSPTPAGRFRDADLSRSDRVVINLDTDRDYNVYYRLAISAAGLVREDCGSGRDWDPDWFVAHTDDGTGWSFEAAIPLEELATPRNNSALWALSATRLTGHREVAKTCQSNRFGAEVPIPYRSTDRLQLAPPVDPDCWLMVLMPWAQTTQAKMPEPVSESGSAGK